MSSNSWWQTLITGNGLTHPTLTAAAAASALNGGSKFNFPANQLKVGDSFSVKASGIISCVVTTPGTARFDVRFGSAVVFDSLALNLNTTAKTSVPWFLDIDLEVISIGSGTSATILGQGTFTSEAVVGSPLPSAGGNGVLNIPVSSIAVGTGFDSTTSNVIDMFFTQTVATGSMTLKKYRLAYCT